MFLYLKRNREEKETTKEQKPKVDTCCAAGGDRFDKI
jgi:hypothetical protein